MKKAILATAISLTALSANADLTRPEVKDLVEQQLELTADLYGGAKACNMDNVASKVLASSMKNIRNQFVKDSMDDTLLSMMWTNATIASENKWGKTWRGIERNLKNKEIKDLCNNTMKVEIDKVLDVWKI